jgi:hypothetical protein
MGHPIDDSFTVIFGSGRAELQNLFKKIVKSNSQYVLVGPIYWAGIKKTIF